MFESVFGAGSKFGIADVVGSSFSSIEIARDDIVSFDGKLPLIKSVSMKENHTTLLGLRERLLLG